MGYLVVPAALKQRRTSEDVIKCKNLRHRKNGEAQVTARLSPVTSCCVPVDQSLQGNRFKDLSFSVPKQLIGIPSLARTPISAMAGPGFTLRAYMQVKKLRQKERSAVHGLGV
jgi:hypothetical protein